MNTQFARRHWRLFTLLVAACLAAVVFAAIRGASVENNSARFETGDMTAEGPQAAPVLAALPSTAGRTPAASSAAGGQTGGAAVPASDQPRLLIKTGTLSLVIKDIDASFGQIGAIARQYGGDVLQYTTTKTGDARVMDIVIQVDSREFENAMQALRNLPDVAERKVDKAESQDVTEEFVDIQSQLTNLKLTEEQLRGILEKSTRTEDILAVQRELTNVRGQIEKLQGRANYLERRANLSNIAIHLEMPPITAGSASNPSSGRSFTGAIARAWSNSLAMLETVAIAVASVIVFCWWLVPLLLVGWLALRLARRTRPAPPPPAATSGD